MGTEINYFYIKDDDILYKRDRKPSCSPLDWHEIYQGYDTFLEHLDYFRENIYSTAFGEVIVDEDLKLLLFYIKYCEIGGDSISFIGDLIAEKIRPSWAGWKIRWACGGKSETRNYIEKRKLGNLSCIESAYITTDTVDYTFWLDSVSGEYQPTQTEIYKPLNHLDNILLQIVDHNKNQHPDVWEDIVHSDLEMEIGPYSYDFMTTMLYITGNGEYKNFHFDSSLKTLLENQALDNYCKNNTSLVDTLACFPSSLRWCLSTWCAENSLVINHVNKTIIIVPSERELYSIKELLKVRYWNNLKVVVDLPLVVEHRKKVREHQT